MKVYILANGYLVRASNLSIIPIYAVLVDHPSAKILFDTGCHPNAMHGRWPLLWADNFPYYFREDQRVENQLKLAGYSPLDVDIVVQSHLHLDHAGNLELFTHADVYVPKEDFEYASGLIQNPDTTAHGAYVKADLMVPCNYKLVEKDFELVPGVEIITLPGHTPGLLGLMVHLTQEGTLIFPMDALNERATLEPEPRLPGIIYDSGRFISSIKKIRDLVRLHKAQVMFPHDLKFFRNMRKAPRFYF